MPLWSVQPAYTRTFYTSVGAVRFYMQVRQSEYEGKARKPPGIEGNTQPDGTTRKRSGRRASIRESWRSIREPVGGTVFDDRNGVVHSHGKISPAKERGRETRGKIKGHISGDGKRRRNQRNYLQNPQSVSAKSHTPWAIHTPSIPARDSRKWRGAYRMNTRKR